MNPLSLRTSSLNNFTSSVISKTVLFGNSYSTLTIWLEKDCERTYQRRFSRAVIKTAMTGIRSAGSFLFPRAHKWEDLLPKAFACRPIIIADFFRKCISCLKCTNSVLLKELHLHGTKWKRVFSLEALVAIAQCCCQGVCCYSLVWKGSAGPCLLSQILEWEAAGIDMGLSSCTDEKLAGIKNMLQIRI